VTSLTSRQLWLEIGAWLNDHRLSLNQEEINRIASAQEVIACADGDQPKRKPPKPELPGTEQEIPPNTYAGRRNLIPPDATIKPTGFKPRLRIAGDRGRLFKLIPPEGIPYYKLKEAVKQEVPKMAKYTGMLVWIFHDRHLLKVIEPNYNQPPGEQQ